MPFVTAGLDVRFRRPAPLYEAVELRAAVIRAYEGEITAEVQLVADGKTRANALASWRRWRPRHE
jgi:acyl-CoA thioesterase FadM